MKQTDTYYRLLVHTEGHGGFFKQAMAAYIFGVIATDNQHVYRKLAQAGGAAFDNALTPSVTTMAPSGMSWAYQPSNHAHDEAEGSLMCFSQNGNPGEVWWSLIPDADAASVEFRFDKKPEQWQVDAVHARAKEFVDAYPKQGSHLGPAPSMITGTSLLKVTTTLETQEIYCD